MDTSPEPGMELIEVWGYRCHRCGHTWVPRAKREKPKVCPKCKNPYWDRPRRDSDSVGQADAATSTKTRRAKPAGRSGVGEE